MASTRNKNTPGNYCLEQRQNQGTERWLLYENGASGNAYDPRFAGNGFNPGKMSRDALSHNPISIESFLFGINSTNLVTPAPPLTPMLMCLSSANVFEHKPVIMPVPQAIRKNERPFPVP